MTNDIFSITKNLMSAGKGILAADESVQSANEKRLALIGLEGTYENRLRFRELFLTAPEIEDYLSGVILHEETLFQNCSTGQTFAEQLLSRGIIPGIKVDEGLEKISPESEEEITKGLETLGERLMKYKNGNAQFAKWRAAFLINEEKNYPSEKAIRINCERMAIYANKCQKLGIVPIVEPEILMSGKHGLLTSSIILDKVLNHLFSSLKENGVNMEGLILKTSMVHQGKDSEEIVLPYEIANKTAEILLQNVPENIGGVVFLSGGQDTYEATKNLNALALLEPMPFEITFSYARAIQMPVLEIWQGKDYNIKPAQEKLLEVLNNLILADKGEYYG